MAAGFSVAWEVKDASEVADGKRKRAWKTLLEPAILLKTMEWC